MAVIEHVFTIVLAVFIVHACNGTSVHDAREEDIMTRLAALEKNQRESQSEIRALRETVADQKDTIDKQSVRLGTLEHDIMSLKASQYRQAKRLQRTERLLQSLLKADRRGTTETGENMDEPHDSPVMPPRRHDNVEKSVSGFGRIEQFPKEGANVNVPKRQASEGRIAFSVYLDHDAELGAQQVIKYNKVITNEGNGYNTHTGVFTCTMDGMYLFSYFIGERDMHQMYAALKVNSQPLVEAIVEGFHTAQDLQGGNTVAFRLRQGDSVWVESTGSRQHLEGSPTLRYTTFTGVFLYP